MTTPAADPPATTEHDAPVGDLANLHWAACGPDDGPLVVLLHGWPERWVSWRHALGALGAAGWRAVAPDLRGYGQTSAPHEVDRYTLLHLVGDVTALVRTLGRERAVVVGHDWGAALAWHCALLKPAMFHAVVGMSVPYAPPAATHLLAALEARGIRDFYMQYFQDEGVAEAEFELDLDATLRRIHFSGSGDRPPPAKGAGAPIFGLLAPGRVGGFLASTVDPLADGGTLPAWMDARDQAAYVDGFARHGFRGPLNWYRNFERSCALLAPWRGEPIRQPSMFIAGSADAVLRFPGSKAQIDRYPQTLPGLRGLHLLDGAGHWIQRERAADVSRLLVDFVRGL